MVGHQNRMDDRDSDDHHRERIQETSKYHIEYRHDDQQGPWGKIQVHDGLSQNINYPGTRQKRIEDGCQSYDHE